MLNVAVVGAGSWGKNLVRNFASVDGAWLHTICDRDRKRLDALGPAYPDARLSSELDEVLADGEVEAVAIATDADLHFEHAAAALQAGKHVYVEKPMCRTTGQARELLERVRESGLRLMVGHLLLYHPAVTKLKDVIDSGELGTIYYMYTQRLNLGVVRSGENAWWSLAPHDVSVILHLFGDLPERVSAQGQCYLQEGIEDVVFATLYFSDGRMAEVHTSWLDPHKMRRMTIVGSEKMVTFDDVEPAEKVKVYDKSARGNLSYNSYGEAITLRQGDIYIPRVEMSEPLKLECVHFVSSVTNGREPLSGAQNGLEVVRVLEAGERSIKDGGRPAEV